MFTNIKSVFDHHVGVKVYDAKLAKKIKLFGNSFVHKNPDHVNFFGGNLLGVHPVRFVSSDKYEWLEDIISLDELETKNDIKNLPSINPNWIRGTDVMNISCLYLLHKFQTSALNEKQKYDAMFDTLLVMHYKLIGSLMAYFFKYPADERTALATYAALSKKYAIKQHGSWKKLLEARCEDILSHKSIHRLTIQRFDDDDAIQYMITDIQGRLRSIIKNLWEVFDEIIQKNSKFGTTGSLIELDGTLTVKDLSRHYDAYKNYIKDVAVDKPRFVKMELIEIVVGVITTAPEAPLQDTLNLLSDLASKRDKNIEELLEETMVHAFAFLERDPTNRTMLKDIPRLLSRLKAIYTSSISTDPSLLKMRKLSEGIVKKAIKSKNPTVVASLRTAVLLYLVLRTFTMHYYE